MRIGPPSAGVKHHFESAVLAIGLAFAECFAAFGQELAVPGIRREVIRAAAGPSNTELDFPRPRLSLRHGAGCAGAA